MTSYPDSVRYLYSLGNEIKSLKLGLETITALLDAMGRPDRAYRSIHVAGTNGKGSTCAMIESGLRAAGFRTGLYTSPHLSEPTERIRINGVQVSAAQFAAAFDHVHRIADPLFEAHPTYFETVTAMAFHLFREEQIEWAVVEVGLGGRLDATNAIRPDLTVITPVDFDHEAWLGSSLDAIAGEKAGILKPGVPLVLAAQHGEARARILREAQAKGVPVLEDRAAGPVFTPEGCSFDWNGLRIEYGLAGDHQVQNAITAAVALHHSGVPPAAIQSGLRTVSWPGRLERVSRNPDVILDGAHNPAGVRALAAYIRRWCADRRVWLVYGTMRDKSIEEIGDMLSPVVTEVILTAPDSPRALRPEAVAEIFDHPSVRIAPDLRGALSLTAAASPQDVIFITGSLFLVGEARALFVK